MPTQHDPQHQPSRRAFLTSSLAAGLGGAGILSGGRLGASMRDQDLVRAGGAMAPRAPHFAPKAKSVIFLFMYGGPSQVDTFDYKPALYRLDGKSIQVKTRGRGGARDTGRVVGPKWRFKQYGQSGRWVSDLFPNLAQHVDRMAFVHSMYAESPIHGSAMFMMNSGRLTTGYPCMGSWVTYGLGSANPDLPGHVVMLDSHGGPISGAKNWSSGFMPASYQGVVIRTTGTPILHLDLPEGVSRSRLRRMLDALAAHNQTHLEGRPDASELAARLESYELAYRMQVSAPEALDTSSEPEETRALYGLDRAETADFGRKCVLARRLVERGVRFVQIYSGGAHNDDNWDAHGDLVLNHNHHALATDRPIAGLLADLERRGLLDETLVIWSGEFGRQPTAEYAEGTGRDHNSYGFTLWMAGGGIKGGISVGATDELGSAAVEDRCHVKNLHATVLDRLGFDANELTYFHGGLHHRLVNVAGAEPIIPLLA